MDFQTIRKDFPMIGKFLSENSSLVYLDSAATAQKPLYVINALMNFYQNHYGTVHRGLYSLADEAAHLYHLAREKVRNFLNAKKTEEIIFTKSTTESINLLAASLGKEWIRPGDEILITAMEHHSNIVPWQVLCEEKGAVLKIIPMNLRGELLLEEYQKLLSPKTRLVAVTHISNVLGTINPIEEVIRLAHKEGALVLIDGAQSVSHLSIDVQTLDADFFAFSGHKLFGPTGIGVLYGKEHVLEKMPPYQIGGGMIERVTFEHTTYQGLPLKFEAGTPHIAGAIGLGAAIDYVQKIGLQEIASYEHSLLKYAEEKLLNTIEGVQIIGTAAKKASLISFIVQGTHPADIGALLDLRGICVRTGAHCAHPVIQFFQIPGTVRASLAFYNNKEDIDYFIEALKEVIQSLK